MKKKYYKAQEIADELGISKKTLYNWERKSKLPKARRDPINNYRIYSDEDLKN